MDGEMQTRYEISTEVGRYLFDNKDDAVTAFLMHTDYTLFHGESLDREEIETDLREKGVFKSYPVSIRVCEG